MTAQEGDNLHAPPDAAETRTGRRRLHRLLPRDAHKAQADAEVAVHCGWGRLIFAHTYRDPARLARALEAEAPGERDIAIYVDDPHVVLSHAPHSLFLDPSHSYRLWLTHYRARRDRNRDILIRRIRTEEDTDAINAIYAKAGMVSVPRDYFQSNRTSRTRILLIAEQASTGQILGTVTGIDHVQAFNDPEKGSSLWCLAVDPQASLPGVGEALVRRLAEFFQARGASFLDLSVMHDNAPAIGLYENLGFRRLNTFTLKRKNSTNQRLFIGPQPDAALNPYARIIVNEARRRGIAVDIEDAKGNIFRLSHGGRSIACRESLSDLTSAVALARCDDKSVTRRILAGRGLDVPDQIEAGRAEENRAFLRKHGSVVVKPARGEQGMGISVDIRDAETLSAAIARARRVCDKVLMESFHAGEDLRVIVIGGQVVAGAVRRPARITGDGQSSVRALIEAQSRRRRAATGGESAIPLDEETERCLAQEELSMDSVLPEGKAVAVRRTANLHTGGTIHDVTDHLHPRLVEAALEGAKALNIPVVGFDFLVPSPRAPDYVIIEANERPGLANHEPQPTAERFIDLLFPETRRPQR